MDTYSLEGTLTTPGVLMDSEKGLIEIKGRSIPENSFEFYEPLYQWLTRYRENPKPVTEVNLAMEYFNTSSSKEFIKFFQRLEELHNTGKTVVKIHWYYEADDEEMMEMGEDLRREISIPIEISAVDEI